MVNVLVGEPVQSRGAFAKATGNFAVTTTNIHRHTLCEVTYWKFQVVLIFKRMLYLMCPQVPSLQNKSSVGSTPSSISHAERGLLEIPSN